MLFRFLLFLRNFLVSWRLSLWFFLFWREFSSYWWSYFFYEALLILLISCIFRGCFFLYDGINNLLFFHFRVLLSLNPRGRLIYESLLEFLLIWKSRLEACILNVVRMNWRLLRGVRNERRLFVQISLEHDHRFYFSNYISFLRRVLTSYWVFFLWQRHSLLKRSQVWCIIVYQLRSRILLLDTLLIIKLFLIGLLFLFRWRLWFFNWNGRLSLNSTLLLSWYLGMNRLCFQRR